ncbi:hypothetical protein [Streptomyces sp. SD15]
MTQSLIEHVINGEPLDLATGEVVHEAAMRTWNEDRTIPASVIRDILRGRLAPEPDPHGVQLRGARIAGRLDLANIATTVPLVLTDCLLTSGLTVRNAHLPALSLGGCLLEHPDQPPLDAEGVRVEHDVLLDAGFKAVGGGRRGAVCLLGARIGGVLSCSRARLHNDAGPALNADRLQVDQSVFLIQGFEAVGDDAVRLVRANIGSNLGCSRAQFRAIAGTGLHADGLEVGSDVHLHCIALAVGRNSAVRLVGARIGGQLSCDWAKLRSDAGPALTAQSLQVGEGVFLSDWFEATGGGPSVTVNLMNARVGGTWIFAPHRLEHQTDPALRLDVDGLEYAGLPERGWRDWLRLLGEATPAYRAQPYQQLAAAHRAAGHDRDVRAVLIAQRRDQLRRADAGVGERAWGRFTGITLGYGYQPWRALIGLFATVLAAVLLAAAGPGAHGGLAAAPGDSIAGPCTSIDRVGVGLDIGLPLIKTGSRVRCDTTNTTAGQALTVSGWILQALAWAFATLFVAGFTSAVRRT